MFAIPEFANLLKSLDPHDVSTLILFGFAALVVVALVIALRPAQAELDPAFYGTDEQREAEIQFWEDLYAGPCRLTEREIWRHAAKLSRIRAGGKEPEPGAIVTAFAEILRHVGRAL